MSSLMKSLEEKKQTNKLEEGGFLRTPEHASGLRGRGRRASKGKKHFTRVWITSLTQGREAGYGELNKKNIRKAIPVVPLCGLKCLVHHESKDVVLLGTVRMHEAISDSPVISGALLLFSGYSSVTLNTL